MLAIDILCLLPKAKSSNHDFIVSTDRNTMLTRAIPVLMVISKISSTSLVDNPVI